MKKLLSVLSSTLQGGVRGGLLFVALLATTALWAEDFEVDGIYYNILTDKTNEVEVTFRGSAYDSYYDEYSGSVTIPSTITYYGTTYSVTSIGGRAFNRCFSLTSVTIGNSVTSIGDYAFYFCTELASIAIPNSVTTIGEAAFAECDALTSITIPNSVTNIKSRAFSACSYLTSIIVENDNPIYDSRDNCNAIIKTSTNTLVEACKGTIIPNTTTSIGDYAFYLRNMGSIDIPNSVTNIGNHAFAGCFSLKSITIPDNVTTIAEYAFERCDSLASINIPENVTSLEDRAFSGCSSLDTIYCYVKTPLEITRATFAKYNAILFVPCESLDAYLADKVWKRFDNIQCLGDEIPQEGNSIYYTSSDGNIVKPNAYPSATEVFGANIISNTYENGQGIITFDGAVTSIGNNAFLNCSSLTSITIPNSITSIGVHAFDDCESLISINIPNSITSIGEMAFAWCSSLTSIEIPNSLISIENGTFVNCSSLTSITIPNSVTNIGESAFRYCSSLTSITIPENVTSIGKQAFAESSSLDTIYCYIKTPLEITADIFSQYNATLYVPCESLEVYKAHEVWGQFENIKCIEDVETDAENIHTQSPMTNCQKIIQDNQLLILRDDKTYNIVGQIVE